MNLTSHTHKCTWVSRTFGTTSDNWRQFCWDARTEDEITTLLQEMPLRPVLERYHRKIVADAHRISLEEIKCPSVEEHLPSIITAYQDRATKSSLLIENCLRNTMLEVENDESWMQRSRESMANHIHYIENRYSASPTSKLRS